MWFHDKSRRERFAIVHGGVFHEGAVTRRKTVAGACIARPLWKSYQ